MGCSSSKHTVEFYRSDPKLLPIRYASIVEFIDWMYVYKVAEMSPPLTLLYTKASEAIERGETTASAEFVHTWLCNKRPIFVRLRSMQLLREHLWQKVSRVSKELTSKELLKLQFGTSPFDYPVWGGHGWGSHDEEFTVVPSEATEKEQAIELQAVQFHTEE